MNEPLDWHDLDQLADFTAGELSGPEAARVAHLIATDARWSAVHRALRSAEPAVRTALGTASAATEAMPADVAARLTTALAPAPRPSVPRRRVWRRRPVLVAVAAAVALACGAGGIASLAPLLGSSADKSTNAEAPAKDSPPLVPATALMSAPAALFATGTDYHRDTLGRVAQLPATGETELNGPPRLDDASGFSPLGSTDGFVACLAAVHERHPGAVLVADFARFDGEPAVIMQIGRPPGAVVIAVSSDCGRDGDAHELAAVELP